MQKIEKVVINTALPEEKIKQNILDARKYCVTPISELPDWREGRTAAIIGGGPSLPEKLHKLKDYKYIMVLGSAHDYLIENGITPTWCAVCDPDPITINYLQKSNGKIQYLIASQCAPEVFEHLKDKNVTMWHLMGEKFDHTVYGEGELCISGGCTILTRAMVIAMGMGFYNLHLFGCDTCLGLTGQHHAYEWSDSSKEQTYDETKVQFERDGPIFKVAGYHLGQLFDIKALCGRYANRMQITVHGGSLLHYFMELAQKRLNLKKEWDSKHGDLTGLNGAGFEPVSSIQDSPQP